MDMNDRSPKAVYTIVERGGDAKNLWLRIGIAFPNRDRSLNVLLDAVPVNGRLHIRESAQDENGRGLPENRGTGPRRDADVSAA